MPVTHVPTTVQIFIVVVMPGTHVTTTVQKFIVVVTPGTRVPTTVTELYRRSMPVTHVTTTVQKLIVKEGRKGGMIQKVALKSLKIEYV